MKSALRRFRNVTRTPVPLAPYGYPNSTMFNLGGGTPNREAHMRAYGVMGTVHSCVSLYAFSTARAEWKMFKRQPVDARRRYSTTDNPSDQRVEVVNHAALSLINQPNDFYTRFKLFELDQMYLDLTGEHYWIVGRGGVNFPTSLWPVRPDRMDPVPDPDNYLLGWMYTSPDGRERVPLQVDEVIQSTYPNPMDPFHGLGPVQSILVDIDSARYSAEWNRSFFWNSAEPGGVVTVPDTWDDKEFDKFTAQWRETHRGVNAAHRVAILENGATWTPNQMSMRDMDFAALRNLSRDVVREAFRMHKVLLGVSDDVNRANAQTGEEVFASWGVVPRLERKRDMLNNVLLPMFGAPGQGVEFDFVTPVPTNREEDRQELVAKCAGAQALITAGFDPHDVLEVVGLPDMDVAEKATQLPGLPPGWVPGPPAAPATSDAPAVPQTQDSMTDLLRRVLNDGYVPIDSGRR